MFNTNIPYSVPVTPYGTNGNGNGLFGGDSWAWIIVLLLLFGWGGNGGFGLGGFGQYVLFRRRYDMVQRLRDT